MFAEFSPEALEAFLDGGLVPDAEGGYRLACDPEDEARIYEGAAAHDAWDGLGAHPVPHSLAGRGAQPRGATRRAGDDRRPAGGAGRERDRGRNGPRRRR